jgi:SAM-dependent methyltransferase/CBS domain-containing protein
MLTARDIMTPLSECVSEDDTVLEASRCLLDLWFGGAPVLSRDGRVRGSLQAKHVLMTLVEGKDAAQTRVEEVSAIGNGELAPDDLAVPASYSVDAIQRTMEDRGTDHLLVKEGDSPIGVIGPLDIATHTYKAPDGLPLPPPELIHLIGPYRRRMLYQRFYEDGARFAETIRRILGQHGADISEFEAILDFGCGCGRVIRHWNNLNKPRLYGSDYDASQIDWCRRNLPFAKFAVNDLAPPLPFEDDAFDFVYALSVLTHLDSDLQTSTLSELRRVCRPNGLLLVTVLGLAHLTDLNIEQRERFHDGELVVVRPDIPGMKDCVAFHPERYIRETLARDLSILTILPSNASKIGQDVVLLRNVQDA